jgi:transcriptional regulator with XRE-family HTH domain
MPNKQRTSEELAFNKIVGSNIKYLRKTRNLNQTKVAVALGTSFQQVQKYEKGKNGCSAIKLKLLADFFKVGTDVLIDPQMIKTHRGFTGNMDWMEDKKTPQVFDASKYDEFEDEYPAPLSQLENDPKMRATYDAILDDK